jgi:hypothetical protein
MSTPLAVSIRTLIVIGAFCPAWAGARSTEVNVIVDFTPEGRKVSHPTSGSPAYYYPVLGSFEELGAGEAGEKPPARWSVGHVLAEELAKQGYLEMSPSPYVNPAGQVTYRDGTVVTVPAHPARGSRLELNGPGDVALTRAALEAPDGPYSLKRGPSATAREPAADPSRAAEILYRTDPVHGPVMHGMPTLVLCVQYGYVNPQNVNFVAGSNDPASEINFNQRQMMGLVAGNTLGKLDADFDRQAVMQRTKQDRYFVMVSAYDFEAYRASHRVVLLWQAKMSAPSDVLPEFSAALDALTRAGGPLFGRETIRPATLILPVTPDGHVEIGTPEVKDYSYALPPVPTTPSR